MHIKLMKKFNIFYFCMLEPWIYEHKEKFKSCFSEKYNVNKLVHVEIFDRIEDAIFREKCLKKWNRKWKIRLIEETNPEWDDLYETIV